MWKVATILMDIDGTMTECLPGAEKVETNPLAHLIRLVSEQYDISDEEAECRIRSCGDVETQCISKVLPALRIAGQAFFDVMSSVMKKKIIITPDTLRFLEAMKEKNIPVCTATTNSKFMTLVKLSVAGIADLNGCPYISNYHPGCEFDDPEGKFSPDYFPSILRRHAYQPAYTMMVGDEPPHDLYPALKAGIRYGVIIDRRQKEPLYFQGNGIFINSLDVLSNLLEGTL